MKRKIDNIDSFISALYETWRRAKILIDETQKFGEVKKEIKEEVFETICRRFLELATGEELTALYRSMAKRLHPDKGGSKEMMARLNSLWDIIKRQRQIK